MMKVVSGGQTGVERAALDVGMAIGLEVGGWCPRDRWAEDGRIPERYPLFETRSPDAHVRTQRNVECSSATLILTRGAPMGSARSAVEIAESMRRPLLVVDLSQRSVHAAEQVARWLEEHCPAVLNVSGPRESGAPGIGEQARAVLAEALLLAQLPVRRPVELTRPRIEERARA